MGRAIPGRLVVASMDRNLARRLRLSLHEDVDRTVEVYGGDRLSETLARLSGGAVIVDISLWRYLRSAPRRAELPVVVLVCPSGNLLELAASLDLGNGFAFSDLNIQNLRLILELARFDLCAVPAGLVPLPSRWQLQLARVPELTDRERGLLRLLPSGESDQQIANRIGRTEATVKATLHRIAQRLGLRNRTEAAVFWHRLEERRLVPETGGRRRGAPRVRRYP